LGIWDLADWDQADWGSGIRDLGSVFGGPLPAACPEAEERVSGQKPLTNNLQPATRSLWPADGGR